MKNIILSADSEDAVYSVPDAVADDLVKYCDDFYEWMKTSQDAAHLRKNNGEYDYFSYTEKDFVEYLNKWVFPNEPSVFVEYAGWNDRSKMNRIPEKYRTLPYYNF